MDYSNRRKQPPREAKRHYQNIQRIQNTDPTDNPRLRNEDTNMSEEQSTVETTGIHTPMEQMLQFMQLMKQQDLEREQKQREWESEKKNAADN